MSSRRVRFYSDGIELAAEIHTPAQLAPGERRGAILLCQGFATAAIGKPYSALPEFAQHFIDQGYVAMIFDYRGFGESDGVRWRLVPQEQVADIRNALTFLGIQDQVDPASLGLFGTSFGGSNVVYAAALDERVKCTVSNVPVGCGQRWLRRLREGWQWRDFMGELDEDWKTRVVTGKSRQVPRTHVQWSTEPELQPRVKHLEDNEGFCNELSLETAQAVIDFHPEDVVHRISPRPILFISAEGDVLTPNEAAEELYELAGEPKRWVIIHDVPDHFAVYEDPVRSIIAQEAGDWFARYLPPVPQAARTETFESVTVPTTRRSSQDDRL